MMSRLYAYLASRAAVLATTSAAIGQFIISRFAYIAYQTQYFSRRSLTGSRAASSLEGLFGAVRKTLSIFLAALLQIVFRALIALRLFYYIGLAQSAIDITQAIHSSRRDYAVRPRSKFASRSILQNAAKAYIARVLIQSLKVRCALNQTPSYLTLALAGQITSLLRSVIVTPASYLVEKQISSIFARSNQTACLSLSCVSLYTSRQSTLAFLRRLIEAVDIAMSSMYDRAQTSYSVGNRS